MIELSSVAFFLILEVTFIFVIISVVAVVILFKKKSNQVKSLNELLVRVNNNKEERLNTHYEFMMSEFGYDDNMASNMAKDFVHQEIKFNKQLLQILASNNPKLMPYMDKYIYALADNYRSLQMIKKISEIPESPIAPPAEEISVDGYEAEIKQLQEDNTHLKEELRVTMDTMGKMLSEYTSMQSGEEQEPPDSSLIKKMLNYLYENKKLSTYLGLNKEKQIEICDQLSKFFNLYIRPIIIDIFNFFQKKV